MRAGCGEATTTPAETHVTRNSNMDQKSERIERVSPVYGPPTDYGVRAGIFPWIRAPLLMIAVAFLAACKSSTVETMPCSEEAARLGWQAPVVTSREGDRLDFEDLVDKLAQGRVVYVGESHDRLEHHLNQLEIVCRLHQRDERWVIGMEFFQQPYQKPLDDFVSGVIDEPTMLRETEYYKRWGFDYRLYRPIMQFARERGIPVIALNVPVETTRKVGRVGVEELSEEERATLPDGLDRADESYRDRIEAVFRKHPERARGNLEAFIQVQLLWDEGMAERASDYLVEADERRIIVLAGSGHTLRSGIPQGVARRVAAPGAIVLQGAYGETYADQGDFLLESDQLDLPKAGMLGVFLEADDDGVSVAGFGEGSAAESAGIEKGERILMLDGDSIKSLTDIRLSMLNKRPGDKVSVLVEPAQGDASSAPRRVDVILR